MMTEHLFQMLQSPLFVLKDLWLHVYYNER